MKVKPSSIPSLADAALLANVFLMIVGRGGVGKTSLVCNELATHMGREVFYVNLNGQGPQEVIGYGIPQANGDMNFAAPSVWPTYKRVKDKPVLLFLDELPDYDPAVRALLRSLYPASGDRMVGPHKLGTDVFVVVAGNRREDGTRAAVEDAPFTERCIKVTLEADLSDWLDWYDTKPHLIGSGSHVPAFLRNGTTSGDGLDHFNPPIKMPYDGEPHPCPRTWEAVARLGPIRKTTPETYKDAVRGSVGQATAAAYFGFLQHVDRLPSIEVLRANPDSFVVPKDAAQQYALVSACLATATRGIKDVAIAVHSGGFDWLVSLLLRCRGDIREFGARSAARRGIPLDEHPQSNQLHAR
jgi:hypothetical protein